jgi:flavin-dependent dehydrogenase
VEGIVRVMDGEQDAVIIGGGPAGAMSALLLARAGWRVTIAEARARHRHKTCGYCLSPRVRPILERCGLRQDVERISRGTTRLLHLHLPRAAPISIAVHDDRGEGGLVVERHLFDQLILDHAAAAGARVVQPSRAWLVRPTERPPQQRRRRRRAANVFAEKSIVHLEHAGRRSVIGCGLVVGADGLNSAVARSAGLQPRRIPRHRAYGFAIDLPRPARASRESIDMFVGPEGYLGLVGAGEVLHAAALVRVRGRGPLDPASFREAMARLFPVPGGADGIDLRAPMEIRPVATGPMPWRPRRVAVGRVVLLGDAAGYVEPFTGEGMAWALESAALLAAVVEGTAPGQWSATHAAAYRRAWRRRIGGGQRRCSVIAALLRSTGILTCAAARLRISRPAARLARRVTTACH